MLHPLRKKIGDGLWNFIVSMMISFSLSIMWSRTFLSEGHAIPVLVRCAAILFVFTLVDRMPGRIWKPIFYIAVVCLGTGLAFFGTGPIYEMVQGCKALFLQWAFRPDIGAGSAVFYTAYYAEDLRNLFCLIICSLVYAQVAEDAFGTCVFMFVVFTALPYMLIQFPGYPVLPFSAVDGVRMAAPGAAGLVMVMGSRGGRRTGLLPLAALLTAAALFLAPAEGTVDKDLNRMAEQASWVGRDLFYTGENRDAFSLASTDYMPLKDRLGGSVRKTSDPVMQVTTDSRDHVYMKGSSCDTYTGFGWQDTLSDRGYLFLGPLNGANREKAFGKTQKMETSTVSVNVMMLRNASATIFSPHKIISFNGESDRMVLYFNQTGELYITRNLEKGDRYTVTCLTTDEDDAREYISAYPSENDSLWEQVCSEYLKVPESVSSLVNDITMDVIFGISDPLDRAVAIRDYLRNEYQYSLQTGTPDPDEDFVSWFLLKEKKGYCTYFASAMTIMCRIAGIPARYVIGYAFVPPEDGIKNLTTGDGHAWTEIYLEGFGWLTMDATASSGSGNSQRDEGRDPEKDEKWEVTASTNAPTEKPSGKENNNVENIEDFPGNDEHQTPKPTSTSNVTPTPAPGTESTPENKGDHTTDPPDSTEHQKTGNPSGIFVLMIIVLTLVVFIIVLCVMYHVTSPEYRASRKPEETAHIYYEEAFRICRVKYVDIQDYETWPEYAERIGKEEKNEKLIKAAADYQDSFYKKGHPSDVELAKGFYTEMWSGCGIGLKMKIFHKRLKSK